MDSLHPRGIGIKVLQMSPAALQGEDIK